MVQDAHSPLCIDVDVVRKIRALQRGLKLMRHDVLFAAVLWLNTHGGASIFEGATRLEILLLSTITQEGHLQSRLGGESWIRWGSNEGIANRKNRGKDEKNKVLHFVERM